MQSRLVSLLATGLFLSQMALAYEPLGEGAPVEPVEAVIMITGLDNGTVGRRAELVSAVYYSHAEGSEASGVAGDFSSREVAPGTYLVRAEDIPPPGKDAVKLVFAVGGMTAIFSEHLDMVKLHENEGMNFMILAMMPQDECEETGQVAKQRINKNEVKDYSGSTGFQALSKSGMNWDELDKLCTECECSNPDDRCLPINIEVVTNQLGCSTKSSVAPGCGSWTDLHKEWDSFLAPFLCVKAVACDCQDPNQEPDPAAPGC